MPTASTCRSNGSPTTKITVICINAVIWVERRRNKRPIVIGKAASGQGDLRLAANRAQRPVAAARWHLELWGRSRRISSSFESCSVDLSLLSRYASNSRKGTSAFTLLCMIYAKSSTGEGKEAGTHLFEEVRGIPAKRFFFAGSIASRQFSSQRQNRGRHEGDTTALMPRLALSSS